MTISAHNRSPRCSQSTAEMKKKTKTKQTKPSPTKPNNSRRRSRKLSQGLWVISHRGILHVWLTSHQGGFWKAELMPNLTQAAGHLKLSRHHLKEHPVETSLVRLGKALWSWKADVVKCLCCRSYFGQGRAEDQILLRVYVSSSQKPEDMRVWRKDLTAAFKAWQVQLRTGNHRVA